MQRACLYKCFFLLAVLIQAATCCIAQGSYDQQSSTTRQTRLIVKFAPLPLVDIDPALQAGLELRVLKRLSLQQDIGYGLPNWEGPLPDFRPLGADFLTGGWQRQESWRYRTELRYYPNLRFLFPKTKPQSLLSGFYVAAEYFYKIVGINKTTGAASGGIVTSLDYDQSISRTTTAGHLKAGIQLPLSHDKKSPWSHLFFDFFVGGGQRYITIIQTEGPSVIRTNGTVIDAIRNTRFVPNREGWLPSAASGVKIGWGF